MLLYLSSFVLRSYKLRVGCWPAAPRLLRCAVQAKIWCTLRRKRECYHVTGMIYVQRAQWIIASEN